MSCQKRFGEECRGLCVELSLVAIRTEQRAIEQEKSAQQHEKHRANETREQAEPDTLVCPAPD